MGVWRGTPIPRPAAAAVPGRRRRLRQPWRGRGGGALLGEGLARPVAGSGGCCRLFGVLISGGCWLSPAVRSRVRTGTANKQQSCPVGHFIER
jgi:hypothetical protein